jgi:hypothetical protein
MMNAVDEQCQQNINKGAAIELRAFAPCSCMELRLGGFSSHRSRQAVGMACGIPLAKNQQMRESLSTNGLGRREMELPVWYPSHGQGGNALTKF